MVGCKQTLVLSRLGNDVVDIYVNPDPGTILGLMTPIESESGRRQLEGYVDPVDGIVIWHADSCRMHEFAEERTGSPAYVDSRRFDIGLFDDDIEIDVDRAFRDHPVFVALREYAARHVSGNPAYLAIS